jgi:hypothetical protein
MRSNAEGAACFSTRHAEKTLQFTAEHAEIAEKSKKKNLLELISPGVSHSRENGNRSYNQLETVLIYPGPCASQKRSGIRSMKEEYDFSKGERGKFYHPDVELNVPVYLESDVAAFMRELAAKKGTDIESIVNDWLRKSIELVQSAK